MVGLLVSFWEGLFSGAMLVSGRVPPRERSHIPPNGFQPENHRLSQGLDMGYGHEDGFCFLLNKGDSSGSPFGPFKTIDFHQICFKVWKC